MATQQPPLHGLRVVELAGLAPAPFAGLLLADYGASVLRIDRPSSPSPPIDPLTRHKSSLPLNLKHPPSLRILLALLTRADVLLDPYRPGTLTALSPSLHPSALLRKNPRLIIASLYGYRKDSAYAQMAGHDINYLALSGVLSQLGPTSTHPPYPPANLLADFAGGGLTCTLGILLALLSRSKTGKGQLVSVNMVDGAAYLGTFQRLLRQTSLWDHPRGENLLDGGAPWYQCYQCKDGGWVAVGALEERFFRELVRGLGVDERWNVWRMERGRWEDLRRVLEVKFRERTRAEWGGVFLGTDACVVPVRGQEELEREGWEQRLSVGLSETPGLGIPRDEAWRGKGLPAGEGGERVLREWMNWKEGKDYRWEKGGLVMIDAPKL